jgi:hypothetical protein
MPAKSQAQQKFMGIVHAIQKGDAKASDFSKDAQDTAKEMKPSDAKDFASTKHTGLPKKVGKEGVEQKLKEIIRQTYRESLRESVNEVKYPTNLYVGSVIYGQGFTGLKGIEGGKYYKVVEMDDTTATLVPCDQKGKITGSKKVRHKLDSIEGGIKTAKRGDENGIVIESVNEGISHEAMGIASMTNTRKEAVQKFIDDNDLDALQILKDVTKGGLYERVRFIQALVGTPGNSSFKWYVKNYANESVVNEDVYKSIFEPIDIKIVKPIALNVLGKFGAIDVKKYPNEKIEGHYQVIFKDAETKTLAKNKIGKGSLRKIENLIQRVLKTKNDIITVPMVSGNNFLSFNFAQAIDESVVTEGKKAFRINPPIGKAKYSISSHNGSSTHKDGSDFWDIKIFKNKIDLEKGIKDYKSKGFIEESVISEDIKSDINKFLDKLNKQFPEQEYTTDFKGGKYARIVQQSRKYSGNRSAWGFVAMEDNPSKGFKKGDLLKAAGFNTPAKGARGNILDGTAKYDKWSPVYLR